LNEIQIGPGMISSVKKASQMGYVLKEQSAKNKQFK